MKARRFGAAMDEAPRTVVLVLEGVIIVKLQRAGEVRIPSTDYYGNGV